MKLWVVSSGVCVVFSLCFLSLWASPHTSLERDQTPERDGTSNPIQAISEKM